MKLYVCLEKKDCEANKFSADMNDMVFWENLKSENYKTRLW